MEGFNPDIPPTGVASVRGWKGSEVRGPLVTQFIVRVEGRGVKMEIPRSSNFPADGYRGCRGEGDFGVRGWMRRCPWDFESPRFPLVRFEWEMLGSDLSIQTPTRLHGLAS